MSRLPVAALAAALALSVSSAAFARTTAPDSLHFTVLRDGDKVGFYNLAFHQEAGKLTVAVDTNVVVKIVIVPVYRFEQHGQEVWHDGHLVALSTATNDDGTHHKLKVVADKQGLAVKGDDKALELPPTTIPASLWNPATIGQADLMNTLDGHTMTVKVADLGSDTVSVHGKSRTAHHYAVTGDLARELWYDADGTLVQVRFKAKDNSDIRYVLQ